MVSLARWISRLPVFKNIIPYWLTLVFIRRHYHCGDDGNGRVGGGECSGNESGFAKVPNKDNSTGQ